MIISSEWCLLGCHLCGIDQKFFQEKVETCFLNESKNRFLWLAYHYEITILKSVATQRFFVASFFK